MVSRIFASIAFVTLVAALACFVWLDVTTSGRPLFETAPLPAPGITVQLHGYANEAGTYGLRVDLPGDDADFEQILRDKAPPIPCQITVADVSGGKAVQLVSSQLRASSVVYASRIATYGTEWFKLPQGEFSLQIRNEGCANGYAFPGGVAWIRHIAPIRIRPADYIHLLAYGLGLIGVIASLAAVVSLLTARRSHKRATLDPKP